MTSRSAAAVPGFPTAPYTGAAGAERSYELLDAIDNPVYVWRRHADGRVWLVFANAAGRRETQGEVLALIGGELHELFDRHDPDVARYVLATLDDGMPRRIEHQYRLRSTGEPRWFRTSYMRSAAGEVLIENEDLTEQRLARAELEASEARFRGLFEQSLAPTVLTHLDGAIIRVNAAFCAMLGLTEAQLVETTFRGITHPDDRAASDERRDALVRGELVGHRIEKRFIHADGHVVHADLSARMVRDAAGKPLYLLGQMLDVTARKDVETAQRRERARLAELLERAPSIICTLRAPDHVYEMANEQCRRLIGREDVIGRSVRELIPEIAAQGLLAILDDVLATGQPFVASALPVSIAAAPHGEIAERYLNVVVQPMENLDGTRSGTFVYCVDVTGLVTAERERRQLEAQLRESQKMEAVGRLAGGVAHDFNNLLCAILGYADLALMDAHDTSGVRAEIEEIRKAAQRAAQLTRQLLAFGRRQIRRPTFVEVDAVVRETEGLLSQLLGEPIQLTVQQGAAGAVVHMDPSELDQILVNLAVNARDAMLQGGSVSIETSRAVAAARAGEPRAECVLLTVSDTGCGIDDATLPHIFEPFFTTKGEAGTGLGLSTVYGIVEGAGGRIEVDTTLGAGTRFRVYLPLATDAMPEPAAAATEPAPPAVPATVLLAEDESGVRMLAKRILERAGFRVLVARHGADALLLWREHASEIDVVVTDLVMPELGGRELATELLASRPDLPVLFMSGYSDDEMTRRGIADPRVAFLAKPFSTESLVTAVREAVQRRG
ncbi:MAG TPA: PAS domain S-box protein [Gemmatimonadaceae bacterium]|jgi:PAS domain S-box-containing protein|nr:PAS domain S-box protein [Gemmatimonadaceae bacterium]